MYLASDAVATHALYLKLAETASAQLPKFAKAWGCSSQEQIRRAWQRWGVLTHDIQLKASVVLDRIRANGIAIDNDAAEALSAELCHEMENLEQQIQKCGLLANGVGKPRLIQNRLASIQNKNPELKLKRTASGRFAVDGQSLMSAAVYDQGLAKLYGYEQLNKLQSAFVSKLNRPVIHPKFNVLVKTGRTSSFGGLNFQNLPRDVRVRKLLKARPGHQLISADYKTIELAALAQVNHKQFHVDSQMRRMINEGVDLHRSMAARVLGKPLLEVTDEERRQAKAINFGKPGGMGSTSLKEYAFVSYGVTLSEKQVGEFTSGYFDLFPEMRSYLHEDRKTGELVADYLDLQVEEYYRTCLGWVPENRIERGQLGYWAITVCGDERPRFRNGKAMSPLLVDYVWSRLKKCADDFSEKSHAAIDEKKAADSLASELRTLSQLSSCMTLTGRVRARASYCARRNTLFQGLAADGAKLALWNLYRRGFHIVNFIHDEIVVEVAADGNQRAAAEQIKEIMIRSMREVIPDVAVDVEYQISDTWSKTAPILPQILDQSPTCALAA